MDEKSGSDRVELGEDVGGIARWGSDTVCVSGMEVYGRVATAPTDSPLASEVSFSEYWKVKRVDSIAKESACDVVKGKDGEMLAEETLVTVFDPSGNIVVMLLGSRNVS